MSPGRPTLAERIARGPALVVPGVFDAMSAVLAVEAGFEAIFVSGYGVSASRLGEPDLGLLTPSEMADVVGPICERVPVPVLVDADTGYGGPSNVARTVRELERRGAAGVFLEDQVWPKRCGHMQGKQVVPIAVHQERLRAASAARSSADFLLVGRTDAIAPHGIDEAIRRGVAFREAGADVVFIEAPDSVEQLERIASEVGPPLLVNLIEGGRTPWMDDAWLDARGFRLVLRPLTGLYRAAAALRAAYRELAGTPEGHPDGEGVVFSEFNRMIAASAR